ncbi:MAG TPA: YebC/PmpR family DNA-binding transcriptional regulator, partial [Steroidobacteraceae bacterium]|nr:YebC/PmpR family DNA-binding transcriptional regulator [Steroidobacteraceae bacterium]
MAGHSKWANIQHRKGAQDKRRGKMFTKLIRELTSAVKVAGSDVTANPRLRLAIDKAKAASMPRDTIERAIQRGTGGGDGADYEQVRYEGYGPGGVAVLVDCLTDNRNRTVSEVRHAFAKHGGNLGAEGSVAYLFNHAGVLLFAPGTDETALTEAALEAEAEDVVRNEDGSLEVITEPAGFEAARDALAAAGFATDEGSVTMRPSTSVELEGDAANAMGELIEALEDLDDVQHVYSNAAVAESGLA